jgi:hypothetical protein
MVGILEIKSGLPMNSSVKGGRVKGPGRWFEPGNGPEHSGSGLFFANLRILKRVDRSTLCSKVRVDVQLKLFALVRNIGKIHQYGLTQ